MINLNNVGRNKSVIPLDPAKDKVGVEGGNTTPVQVEIVGNPNLATENGTLQDIKNLLSDVATETSAAAILAALAGTLKVNEPNAARETTLQNLLRATQNIASSVWTDDSGAYYIQRQNTDPSTGQTTITYTDGQGNPSTPGSGLKPASAGAMSLSEFASYWVAIAAGTGYVIGDSIAQLNVYNISTSPPTQVLTAWININSGVTLTSAPPAAHIEPRANNITVANPFINVEAPNGLPLPQNAAKETGGALEAIKTAALALAKETTAQAAHATAQGMLSVLGAPSDPAYGGTGAATIDAVLKGLYARLAAIEGRMPIGPAIENGNLLALANVLGTKADAAWIGAGDGTQNAILKSIFASLKPNVVVIECFSITSNNFNPSGGTKIRVATFENVGTASAIIRPSFGSGTGFYSLDPGKSIEFRAGWNDTYLGFRVDAVGTTVNSIIERYV
jgi:hypothetical protein